MVTGRSVDRSRWHQHNVDEFAGHLADGLPDDARRRRLEILYTLLDFRTWHSLRHDAGLGPDDTHRALLELLHDLAAARFDHPAVPDRGGAP